MAHEKISTLGLSFDDVLLVPSYSEVLPNQVSIGTWLTPRIKMNIPITSSAMDTVTESALAIALAQEGGIGILHKNMTVAEQAAEVDKVKRSESGMIVDPITLSPDQKVADALAIMAKYRISGIPITEGRKLVGILTNRDLRFESRSEMFIRDIMTKMPLHTAPVGTTLEEAKNILLKFKVEKLPVVDEAQNLCGLITVKDINKKLNYPLACKDELGRLRVGGAVGVGEEGLERAQALINAGADAVVVDTAHGHTKSVLDAVSLLRSTFPEANIIAGNVISPEAVESLAKAGADAVKVGIGPGSICTTRIVTGCGMPQITAIMDCAATADRLGIKLIADGGIRHSGDITKALAAGAHCVMLGNLFAGTDEAPGELILYQGRSYKSYRGMGSIGAMKQGSKDRYFQHETDSEAKLVPEGIEGRVPYKGPLAHSVHQLIGGLRSGMGYCGCEAIGALRANTRFIQVTAQGMQESHVHDVIITKEAPNYRMGQ